MKQSTADGAPAPLGWRLRLEWKPADCWIGLFWRRSFNEYAFAGHGYQVHSHQLDVWLCLVPMLPLHLSWAWPCRHSGGRFAETALRHTFVPVHPEQRVIGSRLWVCTQCHRLVDAIQPDSTGPCTPNAE